MMNTAVKSTRKFRPEPVLRAIFKEAELEHRKIQQVFELLGWSNLPEDLKYVIKDDVRCYIDELEGRYSTNSPLVQRRRESIDFWVNSYQDGICSLQSTLDALQTARL